MLDGRDVSGVRQLPLLQVKSAEWFRFTLLRTLFVFVQLWNPARGGSIQFNKTFTKFLLVRRSVVIGVVTERFLHLIMRVP